MTAFRYVASCLATVMLQLCYAGSAAAAINAGDHLNIRVYNHPELSMLTTVDSRGTIQLPVAGVVRVAGFESKDVALELRRRLEAYLPYPAVDVQDTSESQQLFVSGGPGGVLAYAPNETLSAAVSELAKSIQFTDNSQTPPNAQFDRFDHSRLDLKRVTVYRSGKLLGHYDMVALRQTGNPGPTLYANDTVAFANKPVAVTVIGAANSPGVAYLWQDEPLSDAIAQAGGASPAAATGHIEVRHADRPSEMVALGDSLFTSGAQSGDVVVIPTAPRVTVAGLVEKPGVVALQNDFTLLSALSAAGGYNKFGDLRKVQLVHQGVRTEYNIVKLAHGDLSQNPALHDGDTVYVPEGYKTDWSQVFAGLGSLGGLSYLLNHL